MQIGNNVSLPVSETKSLLAPAADRKVPSASWGDLAKYGVIHFGKAALAQGVAFVQPMLFRSLAQEIYQNYSDSEMSATASLGVIGGALAVTLAFDQLCTANTIHKMRSWLGTKDGVPGQPSTAASRALAVLPTAVAGCLVAREWHGDGNAYAGAVLLAVDMAAMVAGWRSGRLQRDTLQQAMSSCLPTLKIVDMDTGEDLTPQQKKTFDDTCLGWRTTLYTAVVFTGALVTVPALRLYMGKNEYAEDWTLRLLAMTAPAINSMLVEGTDELISVLVQSKFAPRQGLAVQVVPGKPKPDWIEQALDHGGLRALMGTLVTDVAQLVSSADRNKDIVSALSTAVSSLAIALMEIRAKSVTVHRDHAENSAAFKRLVDHLVTAVQTQTGVELPRDEIHKKLNTLAREIHEPKGSSRPYKNMGMVLEMDSKEPVWVGDGESTALTDDEKASLGKLQEGHQYASLEGGKAYFMKKGAGIPAQVNDTKSPVNPGQAASNDLEDGLLEEVFTTRPDAQRPDDDRNVIFTPHPKPAERRPSVEMERVASQRPESVKRSEAYAGMSGAQPPVDLALVNGLVLEQAQIVEKDPESQEWTVRVPSGQATGSLVVTMVGSDGTKLVKVPRAIQIR